MEQVIDVNVVADEVRLALVEKYREAKEVCPDLQPCLAIVQLGDCKDIYSKERIRMLLMESDEIGIKLDHVVLPSSTSLQVLLNSIHDLNKNPEVHGIKVHFPLNSDEPIDSQAVKDAISPLKDVDCVTSANFGLLSHAESKQFHYIPCTLKCLVELLTHYHIDVKEQSTVVFCKSPAEGAAISVLLLSSDAIVTMCYPTTTNAMQVTRNADILITALNRPQMVKASWIKWGGIVIDCGIAVVADAKEESGQKIVGDVDFKQVSKIAKYVTKVPIGVGPLTSVLLIQNTVELAISEKGILKKKWDISYLPLTIAVPLSTDHDIESNHKPKNIVGLAAEIGLLESELNQYGDFKAKVSLSTLERLHNVKDGNYVLVTGITQTLFGENQSNVTIGLAQALGSRLKANVFACVRQPSEVRSSISKCKSTGEALCQVIPSDEIDFHFTGDTHAVAAANNLLAAALDSRILHEACQSDKALFDHLVPSNTKGKRVFSNIQKRRLRRVGVQKDDPNDLTEEEIKKFVRLDIDASTITWQRVVNACDRYLRQVTIGLSPNEKGLSRQTQFNVTAASEIMAILALATSAADFCERLGKIVVGDNTAGDPITADDLCVTGALAALMKYAVEPTLMQTIEGTPVFIHASPLGSVATGNSSILADKIALKLVGPDGFVVTEAGLGGDMGMEKFFDIKCRQSGLIPRVVVLIATIRGIKLHGGGTAVSEGMEFPRDYVDERCDLIEEGFCIVRKQIENAKNFGFLVVFTLELYFFDNREEIDLVLRLAEEAGVFDIVRCNPCLYGSKGIVALAKAVRTACKAKLPGKVEFLYELNTPIVDKITMIAQKIYGAEGIDLSPVAIQKIDQYTKQGFDGLPICIAKTHLSLSHDPDLKGVPTGFTLPIKDIRRSIGAGFLVAVVDMPVVPDLPTRPFFYDTELDPETLEVTDGW